MSEEKIIHPFTVRLNGELLKRIKILAIQQNKRLYQVIEEAITEKLKEENK